jgi:hypothetical protein
MALFVSSEYRKLGLCMQADSFCHCMSFFLCFGALVLLLPEKNTRTQKTHTTVFLAADRSAWEARRFLTNCLTA